MECPYCSSTYLKVTNKRNSKSGIRRRRECLKCKKRFTTYETIVETTIYVIKKTGKKEKFDIRKVEKGLKKALEKRPITKDQINKMLKKIAKKIKKRKKTEIKSALIGKMVMDELKKTDDVAYLRFASVYREFENANDFKKELKVLR